MRSMACQREFCVGLLHKSQIKILILAHLIYEMFGTEESVFTR